MALYYSNSASTSISGGYLNNHPLSKVYKGNQLVWNFKKSVVDFTVLGNNAFHLSSSAAHGFYFECMDGPGLSAEDKTYERFDVAGRPAYGHFNTSSFGTDYFGFRSLASKFYLPENMYYLFADGTGWSYALKDFDLSKIPYIYKEKVINSETQKEEWHSVSVLLDYENSKKVFSMVIDMSGAFLGKDIIGNAMCGDSTLDMSYAYEGCSFINKATCGRSVVNMQAAFHRCHNITEPPVCGPSVVNMYNTYSDCFKMPGPAAVGPNVVNLAYAYFSCRNITEAACSDSVVDMSGAFERCENIKEPPVCGNSVVNMHRAYWSCKRMPGPAAVGPNVVDLSKAYYGCDNITSYAYGENVVNMSEAFLSCDNLQGSVQVGDKVTDLSSCFVACKNITDATLGNSLQNMYDSFRGCTNLKTISINKTDSIINMRDCFSGCKNLAIQPFTGPNVIDMGGAFSGCSNVYGQPVVGPNTTRLVDCYRRTATYGDMYFPDTDAECSFTGCFHGRDNSTQVVLHVSPNTGWYNAIINSYNFSSQGLNTTYNLYLPNYQGG